MRLAPFVLLSLLTAPALVGQTAGENPRESQLRMLENQRTTAALHGGLDARAALSRQGDAGPARFRPADPPRGERGGLHRERRGGGVPGRRFPTRPPRFNTRAGLKQYINGAYDHLARMLRNQTAASPDRRRAALFGQQMPRWQVWDEIHTHTVWTAGQVVANFRKNGMAPPAFTFF